MDSVVRHCDANSNVAAALFYFDFREKTTQRVDMMLRSLIAQFARQSDAASQILRAVYTATKYGTRHPSHDELLGSLLLMLETYDEAFIVLDALDECNDPTERDKLLKTIERIDGWKTANVHILTTSRPEGDIEIAMKESAEPRPCICIESALVHDDIRAFIQDRLREDPGLVNLRLLPDIQLEIKNVLTYKANGM